MKITTTQRELMEHTISEHGRNWFGTNYGCNNAEEFNKLVKKGYATAETPPKWMGDDVIYRLTKEGKEVLNQ